MLKEGFNVAMSHLQKFSSLQELSSLVSDLAVSCQGPASPVGGETLARPYTVIFMISLAHKWHISGEVTVCVIDIRSILGDPGAVSRF